MYKRNQNLNQQANYASNFSYMKLLCTAMLLLMILIAALYLGSAKEAVLDYNEIPHAVRMLLRCENVSQAQYIHYKNITEAEESRVAAAGRSTSGEVYISKGRSVRSENLFVAEIRISTIDQEQFSSYDWCVKVSSDKDFVKLVPVSYFYQKEILSGYGTFLLVLHKDELKKNNFEAEIYGGIESSDGKEYDILRCGKVNLDIPDYSGTILPELSIDIPLTNNSGDTLGNVSSIEVSTGYAILKIDAPLLVGNHDKEEILSLENSIYACLNNPILIFNDGSQFRISYGYHIHSDGSFYMIKELPEAYHDSAPVAITVSGQEYSLLKSAADRSLICFFKIPLSCFACRRLCGPCRGVSAPQSLPAFSASSQPTP